MALAVLGTIEAAPEVIALSTEASVEIEAAFEAAIASEPTISASLQSLIDKGGKTAIIYGSLSSFQRVLHYLDHLISGIEFSDKKIKKTLVSVLKEADSAIDIFIDFFEKAADTLVWFGFL